MREDPLRHDKAKSARLAEHRAREGWLAWRRHREISLANRPAGKMATFAFRSCTAILKGAVRFARLDRIAHRKALNVNLEQVTLPIAGLPKAFENFSILHISDLHYDVMPSLSWRLAGRLLGVKADLVVMTGDFTDYPVLPPSQIVAHVLRTLRGVSSRHGVLATLGNHDSARVVGPLEDAGVRLLINETIHLHQAGESISVTGLDDVVAFHSSMALDAIKNSGDGFKIILVHSPEVAAEAEGAGYALYLAGHTHGGQVCLPGGYPLITGLRRHRDLFHGFWRFGRMAGHTSAGAGASALPLRLNRPGTVTLISLIAESR
jgi:predicted MPP superfamily phosphohydrolase